MLEVTLPIRQLVEFLLKAGSIDNRFTGFDRANEGARIHRRLQRAAQKEKPDYQPELFLRQSYTVGEVCFTLEGRADGIFAAADGTATVEEIKTSAAPADQLTESYAPEHWAQGQVYAAIYTRQNDLAGARVLLTYFQVETEAVLRYEREYTAQELEVFVQKLLEQYAPWARRSAEWKQESRAGLRELAFPFAQYRAGQKAMIGEVWRACAEGGQLLCQAPTGIGKTVSVLYPALRAMGAEDSGPVFYLTARGTTRAAAENALALLRAANPELALRSIVLTAKDKICLCETRECTPDACPYANGYYSRIKTALWDALDTHTLGAAALQALAEKHTVCPFELGLDLSLWCDVIVGDYNYLFDPVVSLKRFFETKGNYLFLIDEAHNLPGRARDMHSAALRKSQFFAAKKLLGRGKSRLKNDLAKVNELMINWRHECEQAPKQVVFSNRKSEELDRLLLHLCENLQEWLEEHREPGEEHTALLELFFEVRGWLRVSDTFDEHFVFQRSAYGAEVKAQLLCLDPSSFLADNFARGKTAVLFSATLSPAGYYKDLCGLPGARAVALKSPFPRQNLGLWCAADLSTRYRDRDASLTGVADYLAAMAGARRGNYIAFFPSYAYLDAVYGRFCERWPAIAVQKQETAMDEPGKEAFLARFVPEPQATLLGFAVLGGVFGEGVDLAGERLVGVAVVGPGLPQVNPQQEQLREYFEAARGSGFDYAYRFPGMNKVLQAAGRVIRTPQDRGVVLLIDRRFAGADYRRLMPPHWEQFAAVYSPGELQTGLAAFWQTS